MGRGRVELKKIEDRSRRNVTFTKRRNGLFKKAYELGVLCDAEVALIIFSSRGKLYEFSSNPSMLPTLERYQRCQFEEPEPNKPSQEALAKYCSQQEYLKLKEHYDALQRTQRNLLGEDIGPLSTKELESLERQLDSTLKQIRAVKTRFMFDKLNDLHTKEHMLTETNKTLRLRLADGYNQIMPLELNTIPEEVDHYTPHHDEEQQQQHSQIFYQPLECTEPVLQIGYGMEEAGPSVTNYMGGWFPFEA